MSIAQRTAETTWEGSLADGGGMIRSGSGALDGLDVTWAARTEKPGSCDWHHHVARHRR